MENDVERRNAAPHAPDRDVNFDTSVLRLYPGRSNEILIVHNEEEFEERFAYFVDTLKASKFPVIGFNTKWDYTLTSQKQRTKNRQRAYNKFSHETDDSNEPQYIREIRKSKEASGHIAIISMSNLYGVTLQIRTCLFQRHNVPPKLKTFLESMDCIKVGFGLRRDMYRLWEEEIIHLNRFVDIRNVLIRWSALRSNYHFRRMGTYSVASYLFGMDFHNPSRVAAYSDWYAANLPPQMSENLAKQTQLDVDLFAQMIVKRFGPNQGEEDGECGPEFDNFDWLSSQEQQLNQLTEPHMNAQFEKSAYNFAYAPSIVDRFIQSQCQSLSPNFVPLRYIDRDRDKFLRKKFGAQPFAAADSVLLEQIFEENSGQPIIMESTNPVTGEIIKISLRPANEDDDNIEEIVLDGDCNPESELIGLKLSRRQQNLAGDSEKCYEKALEKVNRQHLKSLNNHHETSDNEDEFFFQRRLPISKPIFQNVKSKWDENEECEGVLDMEALNLDDGPCTSASYEVTNSNHSKTSKESSVQQKSSEFNYNNPDFPAYDGFMDRKHNLVEFPQQRWDDSLNRSNFSNQYGTWDSAPKTQLSFVQNDNQNRSNAFYDSNLSPKVNQSSFCHNDNRSQSSTSYKSSASIFSMKSRSSPVPIIGKNPINHASGSEEERPPITIARSPETLNALLSSNAINLSGGRSLTYQNFGAPIDPPCSGIGRGRGRGQTNRPMSPYVPLMPLPMPVVSVNPLSMCSPMTGTPGSAPVSVRSHSSSDSLLTNEKYLRGRGRIFKQ